MPKKIIFKIQLEGQTISYCSEKYQNVISELRDLICNGVPGDKISILIEEIDNTEFEDINTVIGC